MTAQPMDEASLFNAARQLESSEARADFLSQMCADNPPVRVRIEQLLAAFETASQFLEQPPSEFEATIINQSGDDLVASLDGGLTRPFTENQSVVIGSSDHSVLKSLNIELKVPQVTLRDAEGDDPIMKPSSTEIPENIPDGRYRLDCEIARGGMGAILKGRDTDLGRDLAIKVLLDSHRDKPHVIQRFIEEAQIGGQLQHPGIAPIYELGQLSDKRPFFAMKLVKGETLAKLLADRKDVNENRGKFVGIFEQICQTMAYAHSRGVIHRDLKPANIMVGAFGEVQVMDWGVAKILSVGGVADEKRARDKTQGNSVIKTRRGVRTTDSSSIDSSGSETQKGSVLGTPAYMPPEQALGEVDHLDQRADVFGLGAILCAILTGQPPYVGDDGSQIFRLASRGKLDDAYTRLETCGADDELINLTKHCLELEPDDRPKDAGALTERVTDYLESVESKLREAELERASESARLLEQRKRMRVTLIMSATVLLALIAGIAGTSWQAHEAERARVAEAERAEGEKVAKLEAQQAQKKAEQSASQARAANTQAQQRLAQIETANEILNSIFENLDPRVIASNERPLQAILVEKMDQAVEQLEEESIGDPLVVASMQGRFGLSLLGLGEPGKAIVLLEQALATEKALLGPTHPKTLSTMNNLAIAYESAGQLEKAMQLLQKSHQQLAPDDPNKLISMTNLAALYYSAGDRGKAQPLLEETLRHMKKQLGLEHPHTLSTMNNLAQTYQATNQQDKARPMFEETLQLMKAHLGAEHPDTLICMDCLAQAYLDSDEFNKGLPLLEETLRIQNTKLGTEHPSTLNTRTNLASAYQKIGQLEKALRLQEETLKLKNSSLGPNHPDTLTSMNNLAQTYHAANQQDKALPLFEETLQLMKANLGPDHPSTLNTMNNLAMIYQSTGQLGKALPLYEETLKRQKEKLGSEHTKTLNTMNNLATAYCSAKQMDRALPLAEESLAVQKRQLGPEHHKTLHTMHILSSIYWVAGQKSKSFSLFEKTLALRKNTLGAQHPDTLNTMNNLALSYQAAGLSHQAIPLFEELVRFKRVTLGPEHPSTSSNMSRLAHAYRRAERWSEAAEYGQLLIAQKPEDSFRWLIQAPVLMLADEQDAYHILCNRMIQQFHKTTDLVKATHVIKVCLLSSDNTKVEKGLVTLFENALDDGMTPTDLLHSRWCLRGLLALRTGDAELALKSLDQSEEFKPSELSMACNLPVFAIAQHQLQNQEEAEAALETARQLLTHLKEDPRLRGHYDLLIAEILLHEANTKVNGEQK